MDLHKQNKKRLKYGIGFLILLITEVIIALYVHDAIIRPYVGDMLVVILIYCFLRVIVPTGHRWLPLWIFLFAAGIECLQYFHLVQVLGLQDHEFWRIAIGSTFDIKDIVCYGAGCILLEIFSHFQNS